MNYGTNPTISDAHFDRLVAEVMAERAEDVYAVALPAEVISDRIAGRPRYAGVRQGASLGGLQRRTLVLLLTAALLLALTVATAIGIGSSLVRRPILPPAAWTWTGPMTTHRTEGHAVTALSDGRVLVTGETTELFTPAVGRSTAGSWVGLAGMHQPRLGHTATLLPDGRVLVAGGFDLNRNDDLAGLTTAEIFDPAAGTWIAVPDMQMRRKGHTATLLLDGRVLVAGGHVTSDGVTSRVELFDPEAGRWVDAVPMAAPRADHTATRLLDGRVLIAGCQRPGDEGLPEAEIFDPANGSWAAAGPMPYLCQHEATLLVDGRVLVMGDGYDWTGSTGLIDPQTGMWTSSGPMQQARVHFTATLLQDGRVLVAGSGDADYGAHPPGESDPTAEIYDPQTGQWTLTAPMLRARGWHEGTLLNDGRVLLVGGYDLDRSLWDEAEVYDPEADH